jgi:hypothetical protein
MPSCPRSGSGPPPSAGWLGPISICAARARRPTAPVTSARSFIVRPARGGGPCGWALSERGRSTHQRQLSGGARTGSGRTELLPRTCGRCPPSWSRSGSNRPGSDPNRECHDRHSQFQKAMNYILTIIREPLSAPALAIPQRKGPPVGDPVRTWRSAAAAVDHHIIQARPHPDDRVHSGSASPCFCRYRDRRTRF